VDRFSSRAVPDDRRLALVRDADSRNVGSLNFVEACAPWSKTMKRVLVVPWSIAAAY
jgi:hypothetical protein